MKILKILVFSLCVSWAIVAHAGYLSLMMGEASDGGTIWGYLLLFIVFFFIGLVGLFCGCIIKFRNYSSTPNYFNTCFRIAKDEVESFTGYAFGLYLIGTAILTIVSGIIIGTINALFSFITDTKMFIGWIVTLATVGLLGSITVALRTSLHDIKADKYFQNTPNLKSKQSPAALSKNGCPDKILKTPLESLTKEYICPILKTKFVLITAGTFMMGSPENDPDHLNDETLHEVTISKPFYLQATTITHGQWELVMGGDRSNNGKDTDNPVDRVSWNDVQEYIQKLNKLVGGSYYRLPSEAEWEYACRAGRNGIFCFGNDAHILDSNLDDYAWWYGNSGRDNHPVGLKTPNIWGLYDMHGNVNEWVQDWYGDYHSNSVMDPTGPSSGKERVQRGGCYYSSRECCRSAVRGHLFPNGNWYPGALGFRLAASTRVIRGELGNITF